MLSRYFSDQKWTPVDPPSTGTRKNFVTPCRSSSGPSEITSKVHESISRQKNFFGIMDSSQLSILKFYWLTKRVSRRPPYRRIDDCHPGPRYKFERSRQSLKTN